MLRQQVEEHDKVKQEMAMDYKQELKKLQEEVRFDSVRSCIILLFNLDNFVNRLVLLCEMESIYFMGGTGVGIDFSVLKSRQRILPNYMFDTT